MHACGDSEFVDRDNFSAVCLAIDSPPSPLELFQGPEAFFLDLFLRDVLKPLMVDPSDFDEPIGPPP